MNQIERQKIIAANATKLASEMGSGEHSRKSVMAAAKKLGMKDSEGYNVVYKYMTSGSKRGYYSFPSDDNVVTETPVAAMANVATPVMNYHSVQSVTDDEVYIPEKVAEYIKWGEFNTIKKVVESKMFYPIYISGPSGNGKTMMVEQVCANAKREYVRAQISPETDEDDLIGGFRLINGETVFQKGPVIKAMEKGAILLIDEIDRATNKIMCLQGVLEGNPVLLKKTGEVIKPAPGFNVIATANTKGRGSDDGRYTAASIIDDAFLERFVAAIDQPFPNPQVEEKIVMAHMLKYDSVDEDFLKKLVAWSNVIRKTFEADGVDEVISTRRLCHITKTYKIFNDRMKSIALCISRFDEETKDAFLDLYSKVDADVNYGEESTDETVTEEERTSIYDEVK
jgi:cobaltochelatase CobS